MGKSVAADYLRGFGLPVVDTDQIARDLVQPGQPALAEIRDRFGARVIGPNGHLRRDALAAIVFADDGQRKQLEAILHPRIRAAWHDQVRVWKAAALETATDVSGGREAAVAMAGVVVIPLLFETGAQSEFAATICVACSAASQLDRLSARGWSREQTERRIQAQWPIERKLAAADYVVWAEGGVDLTRQQLERILRDLAPTHQGGPHGH